MAIPSVGAAQLATLRGSVHEEGTARPLIGAIVTLDVGAFARATRTDETGAFVFPDVRTGEHLLSVRWLGYEEVRRSVDVRAEAPPIEVSMRRVQALDTVRVRAARQAIYGVVATGRDLRPIPGAAVQVVGVSRRAVADSNGRFFVEIRTPGPYVVRATARNRAPQTISVTVAPDSGVEVALLLDSASGNTRALDAAFADFTMRVTRKRNASALLTRTDLLRDTTLRTVFNAAQSTAGFARAALTWGDTVCIFVDGRPRPTASIHLFDAEEVEAVELYTRSSEPSGTLAERWPRGMPCSSTGRYMSKGTFNVTPSRTKDQRLTKDLVYWVVIWMKH